MKKKIVIITSDGGGGQASITQALQESLGETYTVITRRAFTDILNQIDPIQQLTFGKYVAEDLYNTLSTYKSLWGVHKVIYRFGTWYYRFFFKLIERRFTQFFAQEQIDGVISIIPIINQPILAACEKATIPFLIFSPDINPEMYLEYLNALMPKVPCALAVPVSHSHIDTLAHKKQVPVDFIHEVGFPLRSPFFTTKDPLELKKNYGIPFDKPVILALLGSLGSPNLSIIAEYLAKTEQPVHLILCTGRYETVKKTLNKMVVPSHITTTIVGYTKNMDDYLRMSDIFYTKSGSVSVGEAIHLAIPLLLDATGSVFPWEKFNHGFIEEKGFGKSIKSYQDIPRTINTLLADNAIKLAIMRKNLTDYAFKDGNLEIRNLFNTLCAETSSYHVPSVIHSHTHELFEKKKA